VVTVFIAIAVVVVIFLFFVSQIRTGIAKHDAFMTQVKFIQMYMSDTTQKEFFNRDVDDAVDFGQQMLWDAAEHFNELMHEHVVEGKPVPIGDMRLIQSSIRVLKAAEAMVFIKKNGPIYEDEDETDTDARSEDAFEVASDDKRD
jgi:hypothetical protein